MFKAIFVLRRKVRNEPCGVSRFLAQRSCAQGCKNPRTAAVCCLNETASRSVDGYATVWFDDEKAFQAGFGGDYARTVVLPNNSNFNRFTEIIMLPVGEHVIIG